MMKRAGFNGLKRGNLGWVRKSANGHLILWFQCNKWGWNDTWGSTFTLEFQMAPQPTDAMTGLGRRERIGYVLEGFEELDELRARNNAVIEKLPGTIRRQLVTGTLPDGTEVVLEGYAVDTKKAVYDETRSEQGEATIRFHQMLGRVQDAREVQVKAAILEEYLRTERDAHYRSAAEHWLGQVRKIGASAARPDAPTGAARPPGSGRN